MRPLLFIAGWLVFALMGLAAACICLAGLVVGARRQFVRNTLVAMDRLAAVLCGFSGRYTISAECGSRNERFCRIVRAVLDRIEPGHCRTAAIAEGLAAGY